MKLVDILARELDKWPEDSSCDYCCQSDSSTEVFFGNPAGSVFLSERADETEDVNVTRAQWQAAVDALKAESAPAWVGIGLPPVGTVCEAKTTRGWSRGTIIAHGLPPKENIAVWQEDGERISLGVKEYFRPIRTPEQIAAEEIQKIRDEIKWQKPQLGPCPVEQMYLLGYRKFEIVDN